MWDLLPDEGCWGARPNCLVPLGFKRLLTLIIMSSFMNNNNNNCDFKGLRPRPNHLENINQSDSSRESLNSLHDDYC